MRRTALLLALLLAPAAAPAAAQPPADSARVVAGPEYRAGALKRALLGRSYRPLWTAAVSVPVLDLGTFAGGLTPTETGGGNQTLSLRFRGADGREYAFRSVNKDPGRESGGVPGPGKALLRDQVSSQNPAGALVAGRLMDAAGVLHVDPLLFVMPDDPRLGEFRRQFAGMLGQLEERPGDGFAGAAAVEDTDEMLAALRAGPGDRAVAEEYLTARLMDVLLGDWDRHADQLVWARYDRGGVRWWRPVPRDRDYVFVDYDGVLLDLARSFLPRAARYRPDYGDLYGLLHQARFLDRWLLGGLDRATWDSAAAALRARLTDALIDDAVGRMPAEYRALEGAHLAAVLRARRDRLPAMAAAYYATMAREPEAHGTDAADFAVVERTGDSVEVRLHVGGTEAGEPWFRRRFVAGETREVRVYLHGGDDRAEVRGAGGMLVRVIGGEGGDRLEDRGGGARTAFYDHQGDDVLVRAAGTIVDTRPFERADSVPVGTGVINPSRDWGASGGALTPFASIRPFADLVVGVGPSHTRYGFRREPYATRWYVRALWAPLYTRFGAEARYTRRWTGNSGSYGYLFGRASELEGVYFTGYGSATGDSEGLRHYILFERQALLEPGVVIDRGGGMTLSLAGVIRYTDPEVEPGTPAASSTALGTGAYATAGARAGAAWVRVDSVAFPRRGWTLAAEGSAFPFLAESAGDGDRDGAFWRAGARGTAYLPLGRPVLALRAGGEKVWGDFPIQYAALLGGSPTLRGYSYQRFAGDASAFAGAELRVPVTGSIGALALADAGRVWYRGQSAGGWHTAVGAGAFVAAGGRALSAFFAYGERGILYLRLGLPF
ncbi:MAG TPA: BamA/TamA family outer membrane protein [Longimicrobium sp.]|nr:BamA/TamA family outer membrane protein [Longimicrobium sp.]